MKVLLFSFFIFCISFSVRSQQSVAINTSGTPANSSAILDVSSTTKGMLIPRMDSTQRKGILNKAVGLMVFDTQTNSFWYYQNSGWTELQTVSNDPWQKNGTGIYNNNTGYVGIGTKNPSTKLYVKDSVGLNPATFDGAAPMWVTLAEGGVNRGYIGSYSGNPEDVDFGTYGGNITGKVHLTSGNDIPRLTVMPNGNVGINNQNAQKTLDVNGDIKGENVYINSGGNVSDFLVKNDANGKVGFRKGFYGLGLNYCISLYGVFPSRNRPASSDTATVTGTASLEPFIGEIMLFAGNFEPKNWAFCNGQLLPIAQNTALFSILGTTYGGDGITTFALPDLRDAVPVGMSNNWNEGTTNR